MSRKEPQFDVGRVSWMNNRYPSDRVLREKIIRQESEWFRDKVRRDLCAIKGLNVGKN